MKDLRRRKIPNVDKKVDSAFLFSVVITAIVIIIGIIMEAYVAGGICITTPHAIILCIMCIFSILQFIFVFYQLCCYQPLKEQSQTALLTDYTVLQDKITLKMTGVVDTEVRYKCKDRNNEDLDVIVDCIIDPDGTASLEANLQYTLQLPPAAFTMVSQNKITLKIFGEANENVGITFKDTNNVIKCVVSPGGTPANLECTIECAQDSQQPQFTGCTVLQDMITLKIAGPANKEFDVSFKNANNEVTVNCVIGSDGTATLKGNFQRPHFTGCTVSQNKITLKIFGEANENVGITFKDTNNVIKCVVGSDGTPANLECTIECAQDSQQPQFTGCTVLQDMITLKIAGPANKEFDVSFKNANNEVTVNCVIGSDGTATLKGNFQRPHFTGCTVSQGEITLEIAGPANKNVDVSFKDTNHEVSIVECVIDHDGKATLEGNFQPTHGSNYFKEFPINCHCNSRCCENNCACTSTKVCTYTTKTIILWFLYSLPHVVFYFSMLIIFNFFLHPLSYLVILEYLTFSVVALWIINGVSLAMLFTCCCSFKCTGKMCMSLLTFAAAVIVNLIQIFGWNAVNAFFNDERPQTSDILRLIPIIAVSLLGWYSKGSLLKVFTKLLPKQLPPSAVYQPPLSAENQPFPIEENQSSASAENQPLPSAENQPSRCLLTRCLSSLRYLLPTRRRDYGPIDGTS